MTDQTGQTRRVGYVGAGVMGAGIVKNLRKKGVPVSFVVHRNRDRVAELLAAGATEVPDLAALAAASDVIMLTVPDSSVVEPLLTGPDGIGPHLREGQIVVDMSTSYPASTKKIAQALATRGIVLLDSPLTGSRPQAEAGTLTTMCAGPKQAFEAIQPLLEAFAARVFYVGPSGSGHAIKLVNNFLGQMNLAAIAEALPLAQKYGVDLQAMFDVISVSGGNSNSFQRYVPQYMRREFPLTFQQKYVHKDVRYVTTLAREQGVPMPLAGTLMTLHDMALAGGLGDEDAGAILKLLERFSGITVAAPQP